MIEYVCTNRGDVQMTVNYTDLRKEAIKAVAEYTDGKVAKGQMKDVIEEFLNAIKDHLEKGEEVSIQGFGKFYRTEVKRTKDFVCPLNGKTYKAKSYYRIGFKPSKNLTV